MDPDCAPEKMGPRPERIKRGGVHVLALFAPQPPLSSPGSTGRPSIPETAVIERISLGVLDPPGRAGGRHRVCGGYAFFFTSLTLEKVMPSARSRV
ncbi:hypothetical protein AB7M49_007422 [Bradyrhizobium elkanii]|uniref:Uncharacterized protein n=1 Tax=Bradyrhizobium elkanii TaxID=29448 RepID=A0A8I1YET8_BRAEL|nr:hypothetical protein [Bradyrhizobium elkanii]MCS4005587.1 hypothetical protein [Bradyrhizobium elkanii USDA 61]MCP1931176.1 hypothetical protein [Bradyrhizobium elkanii]MCS3480699.1 hypothetical protein [Bradyrhizobium elkanii]MCS3517507.1 hypothetical protein [Bradyrhizobium elkanii]